MYEELNDYDHSLKAWNSINKRFNSFKNQIPKKNAFLGLDGYVDSLYSLVKSRESVTNWKKMETMKFFGERVLQVAGSSASIERVLKKRVSGGFAPNTCKALNGIGMKVTLMAAVGYPKIQDVFIPLIKNKKNTVIPISNPGETMGLEFNDGKIMLTEFENIFKISWKHLKRRVGMEVLSDKLQIADIVGLGHWSLIIDLTDIWKEMIDEIFPSINTNDKLFFVDLSDIKKRTKDDILEMLNTLKKIEDFMPVLLSLNDQEAIDITKALDGVAVIDPFKPDHSSYYEAGININEKARLSYLVIHSPHFATITAKNLEHYWVTEGYTSKPRFTTGAGDHFHSGTVAGISCGLNPEEAILLGNALTAIFVRTGESPDLENLKKYVSNYFEYIANDNPNF